MTQSNENNLKHTPGPWKINKPPYRNDFGIWQAPIVRTGTTLDINGPMCANAFGVNDEKCLANARLIAAAPGMLESIEQIISLYQHEIDIYREDVLRGGKEHREANKRWTDVLTAIAKATGKKEETV